LGVFHFEIQYKAVKFTSGRI